MEAQGDGPPIVLLHGFTGSGRAWPAGCVDALARRGTVLCVDLPGHGRSRPPAGTFEDVVAAVVGVLDDRAGKGGDEPAAGAPARPVPATWVGYSMGGRVALAAAVLHPDRVGRLVLESASPGLESEDDRTARRDDDEALARRIEADGVGAFVDRWLAMPLFASQGALPATVRASERRRRLGNTAEGLAAALRVYGTGSQPSFWPRLGGIAAETLCLTGALDRRYTDVGRRMARSIPGARHAVVPDAGHAVHLERTMAWVEAVEAFLTG